MGILDGRVAIVLGASRGIGRGIARGLGREGAFVFAGARTVKAGQMRAVGPAGLEVPGSLEETVEEIKEAGGEAIAIHCDVRDDASIEGLIGAAIEHHGRIDILACSLLPDAPFEGQFWKLPLSAWDDQFIVGPRAYYAAARAAAPHMSKAGSGMMAFISSPGGAFDFYGVPYCVARAATDRLAQAIDSELRPSGVAVITLWPTYMRTERVLQAKAGKNPGFSVENEVNLSIHADDPDLAGQVLARLAADGDLLTFSGKVHILNHLAKRYSLKNTDGSAPAPVENVNELISRTGTLAPSAYIQDSE